MYEQQAQQEHYDQKAHSSIFVDGDFVNGAPQGQAPHQLQMCGYSQKLAFWVLTRLKAAAKKAPGFMSEQLRAIDALRDLSRVVADALVYFYIAMSRCHMWVIWLECVPGKGKLG